MIIGACTVEIYLHGVFSLKEKRSLIQPLLKKLRKRFKVAAAEVEHLDSWQSAEIAIVTVSNDAGHVYAVLEKAVHWIEDDYLAVEVGDWAVELR